MTARPSAPRRQPFRVGRLQDFLKSGWFLSIPSRESRQVMMGWGPLRAHHQSPVTKAGEAALFAPDFRLRSERPWISTAAWDLVERDSFAEIIHSQTAHPKQMPDWQEPARAGFERRFEIIMARFHAGILDKAVPVVFSTSQLEIDVDLRLHILQNLARLPGHLIIYGFWGELEDREAHVGTVDAGNLAASGATSNGMIGVTPELLFSLMSDTSGESSLETVALAATRAKPTDLALLAQEAQALLDDPKERAEHQFVIDDISSVLKGFSHVQTGETQVLELPTLFHLKTSIRALLKKPLRLDGAAQLLHPTPALGFAPRSLGVKEMDHWDDGSYRWRYGAPFGVDAILESELNCEVNGRRISEPHLQHLQECVVAIRNIQWQNRDVRLGSGCGVVRASQLEREWQELQLKRDSVKRILGV